MKVLVSGAGGFLGRHVVDQLLQRGHQVRATLRPAARAVHWDDKVDVFRADLRLREGLNAAFHGVDAVLHLAAATSGSEDVQFASTVVATENFLDAMAKSSVRRLVLVSSLVVYDWSKASGTMDENTPLVEKPYDMGGYTIAKLWQERVALRAAQAHGWELAIIRPGFIWGPGHAEIAGMGRRLGPVQLMFGPFTRLPLTHVSNCADAVVAVMEHPNTGGEAFNVIDTDEVRVWRYARTYARESGVGGLLFPIPYAMGLAVAEVASLVSRTLFGDQGRLPSLLSPRRYKWQFKPLRFSNDKLRRIVGWQPHFSFEECVARTYTMERANTALYAQ